MIDGKVYPKHVWVWTIVLSTEHLNSEKIEISVCASKGREFIETV